MQDDEAPPMEADMQHDGTSTMPLQAEEQEAREPEKNSDEALEQQPMKIDPAFAPPPGLALSAGRPAVVPSKDPPSASATSKDLYGVGQEVSVLRSNGSWSVGKISDITEDKITVLLPEGTKNIRKSMMKQLLRKVDSNDIAVPTSKETVLSAQKAKLEVDNARLALENATLKMQQQSMNQGYDPMAAMYNPPLQDPHGYLANPWGIPQAACPPMWFGGEDESKKGWFAQKFMSKKSGKKAAPDNYSWGSASTGASFGQSWQDSWGTSVGTGTSSGAKAEPEVRHNALEDTLPHERTTVMMRNIPNNATREQLIKLFNDEGYLGRYNLVYLPIDLKNKVGLGYAFINFVDNEGANSFTLHFNGFKNWNMQSEKICEVAWSDALQGLDEHVERYRDCPVMHESIPDEFKPVLFKDGERIDFPEPTKRIRAPRPWSRRH